MPDIYLGVVPILRRGEAGEFALGGVSNGGEETGAGMEWAVRMRRLGEATMLDRIVAEGRASVAQIRALAAGSPPFIALHRRPGMEVRRRGVDLAAGTGRRRRLALDCAYAIAPGELDELEVSPTI